ncbi:hypothetical protein ACSBR2_026899 [Camellia fascicularis]
MVASGKLVYRQSGEEVPQLQSGRLVAHNGLLQAIWPYSGHYFPTEENFMEFISFLEEHNVDLSNVKVFFEPSWFCALENCAVDDDETTSVELKSRSMRLSQTESGIS